MRFASTTIGSPATSPVLTIVPQAGATFSIFTIGQGAQTNAALESILTTVAANVVYGASIVGTAAAANKAIAELLNPAASGKVLYVYSLDVFVPVAMAIQVLLNGTSLAPVGTGVNLTAGSAAGVAKVGGGNQLAPTGSLFYTAPSLTANADYIIPQPWLCKIPAGNNLQLQGQTVNQAFTCNVRWFENTN